MDQGVISNFKAYYSKVTMQQLVEEIDADDSSSVHKFWKAYDIKMAIANVKSAWDSVTEQGMKGVWRNVCPDMTESTPTPNATNICTEISQLARQASKRSMTPTSLNFWNHIIKS